MNQKRDLRAVLVVVIVMLASLLVGKVQEARAMVPDDILTMRQVELADLSADGRYLLYGIRTWDTAKNTWRTDFFRRDLDTGQDLQLFTPEDRSWGPRWQPGGWAITYLRQTDAGVGVWMMDGDGGNRRMISAGTGAYGELQWAPDGTAMAWIRSDGAGNYDGVPGLRVVAEGLGYRHLKAGYREGNLNRLFVMDLANGESRRVVDLPVDVREVAWSPDSRSLVFAAKAEADLGLNLNMDLWLVGREGGEPVRLTTNLGPDKDPRWLDDGRIAYLRTEDPLWESSPVEIAVLDPSLGEAGGLEIHTGVQDDYFMRWQVQDDRFYGLKAERGCLDLVRVEKDGLQKLTDGGFDFWSFKLGGDRAVLQGSGQTLPGALFMVDLKAKRPGPPEIIIDPNEDWRHLVELIEPEPFSVEVDGRTIEGWFFKPPHLAEGEKAPTVLSIHGGPEWMYGGYFLSEFHILPQFGYGVVIANPTGSMGYGVEFMKDIRGDWTGRPAREVMACLDFAISEGWADPDRLAVMGGSYGGHLGAALTTQTDRFSAAALDRMFPDPIAFWGTTDEKWFPEWEWGGKPWEPEAKATYLRNSPFEKVDQVTTPTLVSHGMMDYRCLIAGAEMWFSALQSRGVPSRFIRFETEGHGIKDPRNQVFYQGQLLDWFQLHVIEQGSIAPEEHHDND